MSNTLQEAYNEALQKRAPETTPPLVEVVPFRFLHAEIISRKLGLCLHNYSDQQLLDEYLRREKERSLKDLDLACMEAGTGIVRDPPRGMVLGAAMTAERKLG